MKLISIALLIGQTLTLTGKPVLRLEETPKIIIDESIDNTTVICYKNDCKMIKDIFQPFSNTGTIRGLY